MNSELFRLHCTASSLTVRLSCSGAGLATANSSKGSVGSSGVHRSIGTDTESGGAGFELCEAESIETSTSMPSATSLSSPLKRGEGNLRRKQTGLAVAVAASLALTNFSVNIKRRHFMSRNCLDIQISNDITTVPNDHSPSLLR